MPPLLSLRHAVAVWLPFIAVIVPLGRTAAAPVRISGETKVWHKVTVDVDGPFARETDDAPNPFTDYAYEVTFVAEGGSPRYRVPGYFAADGNAANTGATEGKVWRAHFAPDRAGRWTYEISFHSGPLAALNGGGQPVSGLDGLRGSFVVGPTDKRAPDFRAQGRLEYVGRHHLRFAGSGEYFLKVGADAPETLLAYADFDATVASRPNAPLKTWGPHVADWREGDPTWRGGRGKGLIGAVNYLAGKGVNSMSFLTYNAGGDGDNVWPFVSRNDKRHYDCSKLDQWGIVFDHAQASGVHLHFKLQENEIDDDRIGPERRVQAVPESLDHGALGPERKLYLRELIARFGHALALNWNLGEENSQTPVEQRDMAAYIRRLHYYPSNIVLHTFTNEQELVYGPHLGEPALTGLSLQNDWAETHAWTVKWVRESARAGRPWVVANDEQGNWAYGVPPDPGYRGFSGTAPDPRRAYTLDGIRKLTLWGNLMGGGAGVEYYFGYLLPQHDLDAEDFRSRDRSWDYGRIALEFFRRERIPFWDMVPADEAIGNSVGGELGFCLAKPNEVYLVYLPWGGVATLDLRDAAGTYSVRWFNPWTGGDMLTGSVATAIGGRRVRFGQPPTDPDEDWLVLVRRTGK